MHREAADWTDKAPTGELRSGDDGDIFIAPASRARLLVLDLPARSASQRTKSAPFAAEPRVAESIGDLHVAVGHQIEPGRYLCAVASRADMDRWIEEIAENVSEQADIFSELCGLPIPEPGTWNVEEVGDQVLVRTPEGEGFSCAKEALDVITQASDAPKIHRISRSNALHRPVSLRTGPYNRRATYIPGVRTAVTAGLVAAVCALGLLSLEVMALDGLRTSRLEAAQTRLTEIYGETRAAAFQGNPVQALTRLETRQSVQSPSPLDLTLSDMGAVLDRDDISVDVLALDYQAGEVTLALEANSLTALQTLQRAFMERGLAVESGPVAQTEGRAEADLVLRQGVSS